MNRHAGGLSTALANRVRLLNDGQGLRVEGGSRRGLQSHRLSTPARLPDVEFESLEAHSAAVWGPARPGDVDGCRGSVTTPVSFRIVQLAMTVAMRTARTRRLKVGWLPRGVVPCPMSTPTFSAPPDQYSPAPRKHC